MIILYIPFHEKNDLLDGAEIWKKNAKKPVQIIQHKDKFVLSPGVHTVYLLAHESGAGQSTVLNTARDKITAVELSISALVQRFMNDFLPCIDKIENIKLYICNNKENKTEVAIEFQKKLNHLKSLRIDYYHGTLFAPSKDSHKYSKLPTKILRASRTRASLFSLHRNKKPRPYDELCFFQKYKLEYYRSQREDRKNRIQQNRLKYMLN
jgi:hypothetical protein